MSTYTVDTSVPFLRSGRRFIAGGLNDTYQNTRAYLKFDLSASGLLLAQINAVALKVYAGAVYGTPSIHRLRSGSVSDNWGSVLQATEGDWASTDVNIEDEKLVDAVAWYEFAVAKGNLNLSGLTYFRISDTSEGEADYAYVSWTSQNATAATYRPKLKITTN